jgi:AcrR family transcriptional regulator
MSPPSDLSTEAEKSVPRRRVPRQARSEQTVASLLDAAAAEIAEAGYEAATLTHVASRAGMSIGSLYQYFPDKPAVARALAERYGTELADQWEPLIGEAAVLALPKLVQRMFDVVLQFHADRPAFLELATNVAHYRHNQTARGRLRGHIAALLRAKQPSLNASRAARIAEVTVQIFKGMNRAFEKQSQAERKALAEEFKLVVTAYLSNRLRSKGAS